MLAPSPVVKKVAKDALKKDHVKSMVVSCILVFAFFIIMLTSSLISVFAGEVGYYVSFGFMLYLGLAPLALGALCFFRRLTFEQNDSVLIIFRYFSSADEYKRAVYLISILTVKLFSVGLVLFLPCIIVYILSSEKLYKLLGVALPHWTSNLWTLNSFLVIIALLGLVFIMLKYYLSALIFVSSDDIDPAEAVNMSTIISKRTGADFFGMSLSFIPWMLLSVLIAPLIFTLPYFITSYCVHGRFAITDYNIDVDKFNSNTTPSFSTDEI